MFKSLFFIFFFLFSCIAYSQDSTEIPNTVPQNLKPGFRYTIPYALSNNVRDFPEFLQKAIDSVNHRQVVLKMYNDSIVSNGVKTRCEREFRRISVTNKNVWLLSYTHRKPKIHEHFVVFTTKGDKVLKMIAGISDDVVDSIGTIERFKAAKKIKFINLKSRIEAHKF